jgi:hypothetical protein
MLRPCLAGLTQWAQAFLETRRLLRRPDGEVATSANR